MDRNIKEEKIREENRETKSEEIQRITVSKQGHEALVSIVEKVNDGFTGGKVNKAQIANWVLIKFYDSLNESVIKEIRAEHFDEVAMLESILRKAKESGKVPYEFKVLLQKQLETPEPPKRKLKKALTENVPNDYNGV